MGTTPKGKKKSAAKRINLKRAVICAVILVVAAYFMYAMIWQHTMISSKNKEIEELRESITTATEEAERLRQEVEKLNDPEYIERVAREKLGLVRPNERVFVDSNKSEDNGTR